MERQRYTPFSFAVVKKREFRQKETPIHFW
jgi:hypothetical protein